MDVIYSRKRINIPGSKKNPEHIKKTIKVILILVIAVTTAYYIINSLNPIFEGLCAAKAHEVATYITNTKSSEILDNIQYSDIVKIEKDSNGKITLINNDVVKMNKIASDIAVEIQRGLKNVENDSIYIPVGSMTGNKYFAGSGPKIKIKVISAGNIVTDFKTEFVSQGINQTMHRIYLNLECNVNILTPFNKMSQKVVNQVLLVETVIVGEIPESYYNLEGMTKDDVLEVV